MPEGLGSAGQATGDRGRRAGEERRARAPGYSLGWAGLVFRGMAREPEKRCSVAVAGCNAIFVAWPVSFSPSNERVHAVMFSVHTLIRFLAGRLFLVLAEVRHCRPLDASAPVVVDVLVRRYRCPQNAISVAFLRSRSKAGVPVPAGGGMLILKSL